MVKVKQSQAESSWSQIGVKLTELDNFQILKVDEWVNEQKWKKFKIEKLMGNIWVTFSKKING